MKKFGNSEIRRLFNDADGSSRQRAHHLLHNAHSDKVQRLVIALKRKSYIQPHSHSQFHQWESFIVLSGQVKLMTFDESGQVLCVELLEQGNIIEIPPNVIHTLLSITDESLIYEVKEGPFLEQFAKKTENWAPAENSDGVESFVKTLFLASVGANVKVTAS